MEPLLMKAVIFITLALVFYTVGVWSEKIQGHLKPWHLVLFYIGLVCDTIGTTLMSKLSDASYLSLHGITGLIAIILMLVHAVWGTYVLIKNDTEKIHKFHKFSIFVWCVWLVPYILGMVIGMM
ncbi:HsmA family protein [Mollicutes bacterium LVI A0039]|nr:HsmA family protein [Mollicutes bacterium LVI A0039]